MSKYMVKKYPLYRTKPKANINVANKKSYTDYELDVYMMDGCNE